MIRPSRFLLPVAFALLFVSLFPAWPLATAQPPPDQEHGAAPEMPDESHRLLAAHAAQSHGLPAQQVAWIAQGAWDEDHCAFTQYPPCQFAIPNGHHSWDPDTGQWWIVPLWPDLGSGLTRADRLFSNALEARASGDTEAAYLWLGRAIHMLGDMATPAHVHLDTHLPPFDSDRYELWLNQDDLANTRAWIVDHPPGPGWDLEVGSLPAWDQLDGDQQAQLQAASQAYGGRTSGQDLWQLGPQGHDPVVFRLVFLMAEEGDDWNSNDAAGEQHNGDLTDPVYLVQMRDVLFPALVTYAAALLDYYDSLAPPGPEHHVFLPSVHR
jgi:hypothetical protein